MRLKGCWKFVAARGKPEKKKTTKNVGMENLRHCDTAPNCIAARVMNAPLNALSAFRYGTSSENVINT